MKNPVAGTHDINTGYIISIVMGPASSGRGYFVIFKMGVAYDSAYVACTAFNASFSNIDKSNIMDK